MNFGVIGTNFISDNFLDAISKADGAQVCAVCSRTQERGEEFAKRHCIPRVYINLGEMLKDRNIDALYVASPTVCHAEQSIKALNAGKHVLCEKMMAHDYTSCQEMINAAKKHGCVLLEAMRPDFDPAFEIVRNALTKIGKIRRASFEFCQYSSRYDAFLSGTVLNAFNPEIKNSALADIGIYPLHFCLRLFGEPRDISFKSVFLSNGFEGAGSILMDYGDMLANITYSKITDSVRPSVIEGELGSIMIDKINAPHQISLRLRGKPDEMLEYTPVSNNMVYEVRAFMDIVKGKLLADEYLCATAASIKIADKVLSCNK